MRDQILQTAATDAAGVAAAVAYRLHLPDCGHGMPRGKANRIANRVVPIALDAIGQMDGGMVCGGQTMDEIVAGRVKRAVGMWQYLLWRVAIGLISRWIADWWFSGQSQGYRESRGLGD